MDTKSGPTTNRANPHDQNGIPMTHRIAHFTLILPLLLVAGCERQPLPGEAHAPTPSASNQPLNQPAQPLAPASSQADMVLVPAGSFMMGDKDEIDAPPHQVTVSAFYIDKYLVTQDQYEKLIGDNPSRWKGPKNPVEQVRWSDAVKFCNRRSESEGLRPCYDLNTWKCDFSANGYRLPTEAEWEYACRAGSATPYFFGEDAAKLGEYAWYEKNSGGHPRPVGQKQPNAWGLYDTSGNLWEWCNDFYKVNYYKESPGQDPTGPAEGSNRVVRGGAWRFSAERCRAGYRYNENPGYSDVCFGYDIYGFRCVKRK